MSDLKAIRERFESDNLKAVRSDYNGAGEDIIYPDPDYYFSATCKLLKMVDELQDTDWINAHDVAITKLNKLQKKSFAINADNIAMKATIERVRVLPEKWRNTTYVASDNSVIWISGDTCANQLDEALKESK